MCAGGSKRHEEQSGPLPGGARQLQRGVALLHEPAGGHLPLGSAGRGLQHDPPNPEVKLCALQQSFANLCQMPSDLDRLGVLCNSGGS